MPAYLPDKEESFGFKHFTTWLYSVYIFWSWFFSSVLSQFSIKEEAVTGTLGYPSTDDDE